MQDKIVIQFSIDVNYWVRKLSFLGVTCAALGLAYLVGNRHARKNIHKQRGVTENEEIEEILGKFKLDEETLQVVMDLLEEEMDKGLDPNTAHKSDLKMIPSYVRNLPTGSETGKILALDLGGTNFRVLEVDLQEDMHVEITSKIFIIPERLMTGNGLELFDYLAASLASFMKARKLGRRMKRCPLGFTFSFPCQQTAINAAILMEWTKGFHTTDVEGKNVVELLNDALARRNDVKVEIMALVNDTVGTLMTCAHKYRDCLIGVIFGTGTNACYMEDLDKVKTWDGDRDPPKQVIVNTEWGAFGDGGCLEFLRTKYDHDIDDASINPGKQKFEKMISGMYMGELTRLIILDLIQRRLIFPDLLDKGASKLGYIRPIVSPGSFYTRFVSDIETDEGVAFARTKKLLEEFGFEKPTYDDCAILKYVCECVSRRAALLSAAAIAVLVNRIGRSQISIGIDGSLYRYHPRFKRNLEICLSRLVDRKINYRIVLSDDGSGKGAAICAAVEDHIRNKSKENPENVR